MLLTTPWAHSPLVLSNREIVREALMKVLKTVLNGLEVLD
jgi:hypothetical protein